MLSCCFFSQSNVSTSLLLGGSLNKSRIDDIFAKYERSSIRLIRTEGQTATNLSDLYFLEEDHISAIVHRLFKDILVVIGKGPSLVDNVHNGRVLEDIFKNLHTLSRDIYELNEMDERYEPVLVFPDDIKRNKWRSRCIEEIANHKDFLNFIIQFAVRSPADSISKETCEILSSLKGKNIEYYGGLLKPFSHSKFSVDLVDAVTHQGEVNLNSVGERVINQPRFCNIFSKTKTRTMLESQREMLQSIEMA